MSDVNPPPVGPQQPQDLTPVEQSSAKQITKQASKSSSSGGHIYNLLSKLGFKGQTAKVEQVFVKVENALNKSLGVEPSTVDVYKDQHNKKIKEVVTKMSVIGTSLKELQGKMEGNKNPELANKLSNLQKDYVKLGADLDKLQRNEWSLDFDKMKVQIDNVTTSVLELMADLSPDKAMDRVFNIVEKDATQNLKKIPEHKATVAVNMHWLGNELKGMKDKLTAEGKEFPDIAKEFSRLQKIYVSLGDDYLKLSEKNPTASADMMRRLEVAFDEISELKKNFEEASEASYAKDLLYDKNKTVLEDTTPPDITLKEAIQTLDGQYKAIVKSEKSEGKKFEDAITKKIDDVREKGSYVETWNNLRDTDTEQWKPPRQFYRDLVGEGFIVGNNTYDKPADGSATADFVKVRHDEIGESIMDTISETNVAGFNEKSKQLLLYEIEDSLFCQSSYNLAGEAGDKLFADYRNLSMSATSTEKPGHHVYKLVVTPPNTLTVSRTDYFQIKDTREGETQGEVVGYDARKTTMTIDLSLVTEKDLLATNGAVSVQTERHGFRRDLNHIKF